MLAVIGRRVRVAFNGTVSRLASVIRAATRPSPIVTGLVRDVARSKSELVAENTLLRQQLIVVARQVKRPTFRPHDRGLLVLLARLVPHWWQAVLLVQPETIVRWHREGFRLFWRRKCSSINVREPRLAADVTVLIKRMAADNRLWGAERIRGELLKLGIRVAKRTVQRYMRTVRPPAPRGGQRWRTFLRNHTVWAVRLSADV